MCPIYGHWQAKHTPYQSLPLSLSVSTHFLFLCLSLHWQAKHTPYIRLIYLSMSSTHALHTVIFLFSVLLSFCLSAFLSFTNAFSLSFPHSFSLSAALTSQAHALPISSSLPLCLDPFSFSLSFCRSVFFLSLSLIISLSAQHWQFKRTRPICGYFQNTWIILKYPVHHSGGEPGARSVKIYRALFWI